MNFKSSLLVGGVLLALLTGCSGTTSSFIHDARYVLTATPADVELTLEQVAAKPHDVLYFRWEKGSRISLGLAHSSGGRQHWLSADAATLVLASGRIARTVAFKQELLFVTELSQDPLLLSVDALSNSVPWVRQVDWQAGGFHSTELRSQFSEVPATVLDYFGIELPVRKFYEQVTDVRTGQQFQNIFWFSASSGVILRSQQQLFPGGPMIELDYISRAQRLVAGGGS